MNINWPQLLDKTVNFTQRLIQTKSMPREEAEIAALVLEEMRGLNFDEVWQDEIGNVHGRVRGRDRSLPAIVLNSHLDHVDPGDPALWEHSPYSGVIENGRIVGRGASDIKGPLATQLYSAAGLLEHGFRPKRDIIVSSVVQEEIGGTGAKFWAENVDYPIALIVVAEPSSNKVCLGHRGIRPIWVTFHGRSAHASAPHKAINPNYALATFLQRLEENQHRLKKHPRLGGTTVSPTIVEVDTVSRNVTPAWTRVCLDFRTAGESVNSLLAFIHESASDLAYSIGDGYAVDPTTPLPPSDKIVTGYDTDPADPAMNEIVGLIEAGVGQKPTLSQYAFATDGRHFTELGATIIGFAPGDENQAHTANEHIRIDQIEAALKGYTNLLLNF